MILSCDCRSPGQDALHSPGKRVHNPMTSGSGKARCTVCLKEQTLPGEPVKAIGKAKKWG